MTESAGRDPVFPAARAERERREAAGLCLNQAALSSSGRCLFYVLKDRSHGMIGGSKEWHACFGKRPGCQDINAGGWGWGRRFWTQDRAARKLLIESPMVLPHVTSGIIIIFLQTRKARRSVVKLLVRDCNTTMG